MAYPVNFSALLWHSFLALFSRSGSAGRRLMALRELAEGAYFALCLALGWLLRSARYSKVRIIYPDGEPEVRKHRLFYAPLVVWLGGLPVRILNAGVRVLPQRDWEEQERRVYRNL